jgi:hypothetical protein
MKTKAIRIQKHELRVPEKDATKWITHQRNKSKTDLQRQQEFKKYN